MKTVRNLLTLALACLPMLQAAASPKETIVYTGTYTGRGSRGIYAHRFDPATGKITSIGLAAETSNPSFLAAHPNRRFLYAANENGVGTVSAFAIERSSGMLKALNTVSSKGSGPCHLAFDRTGKWLFVANYDNGSVAVLPVHENGTLGEASASIQHAGASVDPQRQAGPHAHAVNIAPDNRLLLVADLGMDQVLAYRFDARTGGLSPGEFPFARMAAGSGPRHLTWSPDGKLVFVLNEMKATVAAMTYDRKSGRLKELQTLSALPDGFPGARSGAEIIFHPKGRVLYTSNRGHDSLAIFDVGKNGALTFRATAGSGGKTPRHFGIDPSGAYLFAANQDSNNVVVFRMNSKTGALTPSGASFEIAAPVCVVFI